MVGVSTKLFTILIWLSLARGESNGSAAKDVNANAVTTAPRMMILVFILFLSYSTELHCPVVCCNWLTPCVGAPRKIIFHKNNACYCGGRGSNGNSGQSNCWKNQNIHKTKG